jgi:hypothetical protein
MGKGIVETHDGKAGPVKVRNGYYPAQPPPASNTTEVKGVMLLEVYVYQVQGGKFFLGHEIYNSIKKRFSPEGAKYLTQSRHFP